MTTQGLGIWIHGSSGRMGQEIQKAILASRGKFRLSGGSDKMFEGETFYQGRAVTPELLGHALAKDKVDVVVDFSTEEGNAMLLAALKKGEAKGVRVLIGTTGLRETRLAEWRQLAQEQQIPVMAAANTSLGVLIAAKAALVAAAPLVRLGFDVEIVETHHKHKKDAPSGTAKFLAQTLVDGVGDLMLTTDRVGARVPGELGVHAVRGGGVFGEHEIRILGEHEEVTIKHRAFSRALFASGALVLAGWLAEQTPGFYGLLDVQIDDLAKRK